MCFLGYIHSLTLVCNCIKLLIISEIFFFAGERCSSWKWGSGKACFLLSRFYGNIEFACMGVWFEVHIWAVQAAVWQRGPRRNCRRLTWGLILHDSPFKYWLYYGRVLSLNLVGIVQKFSHWEVVRHDIVFPVRFFGQVEVHPSGS